MTQKNFFEFSNGVVVVNTTPHALNFLSPEGEKIVIPSSVEDGMKTGPFVVNAKSTEVEVGKFRVKTEFVPDSTSMDVIATIKEQFSHVPSENLFLVGSIIAADTYSDIVGMVAAPGFERVPPQEKLMSSCKFNVGRA